MWWFAESLINSGTMAKKCGWLSLWLCTLPVWSLDPQKAITQLVHTSWTEREGAPASIVALAQTTDGYLWLGTASGLYRFDGVRFTRFEPAAGEELPGTSIAVLCATRNGSLCIASASGAIWVAELTRSAREIRTGRSHDRGPLTEVAVGATIVLFDRQGSLWITSGGDGLRRLAYPGRVRGQHIAQFGPQAEQFTKKDGLSHDYVISALEDREGNIWFVTVGGLDRFRESKVTPVSIPGGDQPRSLLASRDGSIWTGASTRDLQQIGPDGRPVVWN